MTEFSVIDEPRNFPPRVFVYAPPKEGKTSFAAFSPKPVFVMTRGETGLRKLIDSKRIPKTAHLENDVRTWPEFMAGLRWVLESNHDYQTLVIDTINGAELLLANHVLQENFSGQIVGPSGFNAKLAGQKVCFPIWGTLLDLLDQINRRGMGIILLAHAKLDGEKVRPEGWKRLWSVTRGWADVIGFLSREVVEKDGEKIFGRRRMILEQRPNIEAGNRLGLPPVLELGESASSAWKKFAEALAGFEPKTFPPETPFHYQPYRTARIIFLEPKTEAQREANKLINYLGWIDRVMRAIEKHIGAEPHTLTYEDLNETMIPFLRDCVTQEENQRKAKEKILTLIENRLKVKGFDWHLYRVFDPSWKGTPVIEEGLENLGEFLAWLNTSKEELAQRSAKS